jgi:phosphoenolpyruvate carboxykinase (ATP)
MNVKGIQPNTDNLKDLGLNQLSTIYWNLTPAQLVKESVDRKMGVITDTGALAIDTGEFTGRSPKDRFIVCDSKTENAVWWGDINIKFSSEKFDGLYNKMIKYFEGKDVFVRDAYACSSDEFRLNLRVINEYPWSNHFANNMFIDPNKNELADFNPEWHILNAPGFLADPDVDGTRQHNFAVIDFTKKMILIGGTGYTGEIKKGIFSVLNYILPHEKNTLSMHCSANLGKDDDTAIFFGLSGTGKTTFSVGDNTYEGFVNTIENGEEFQYNITVMVDEDEFTWGVY